MPVPRRFDRRPPERDQTRTNERIRVPEVRLVGEDGKQIGVIKTSDALAYAQERDLDLVEVAPDARPPVCRVLDYSKYKYEQAQKQKQARKHQQQITIREIKFRPKIAQNDYDTKKGHVQRFLKGKDRVKVTIMFRGREVTHPERGSALLEKLAEELSELAVVEQRPIQDGRNMTMMLAPSKAVLSGELGGSGGGETAEGDANAASEQKPAASEQKPAASEQKPAASEQKPAASEQKPAASEQKPAASEQKPSGSEQATAAVDKPEACAATPDAEESPNGTAKRGSGRASKKDAAPSGDGAGEPESAPADAPA